MKDSGLLTDYLGLEIVQDTENSKITVTQKKYLLSVLKRFNMQDCYPVDTPMDKNFDYTLLLKVKSESPMLENLCRQIIGCMMYAMLGSRPDLCCSISILSRYQSCASTDLLNCLKRVLRYIKGTLDLKLCFKKSNCPILIKGYADADWAGDQTDRKSTSGFCFKLFNSTISWNSRKQLCTSCSSTEAEYIALSECTSEACWLRGFLIEMCVIDKNYTIPILEDNQSAIKIVKSIEQPKGLKHLDVKYHFIKEKYQEGIIKIEYIPSAEQIADIFTKPLNRQIFTNLRNMLLG